MEKIITFFIFICSFAFCFNNNTFIDNIFALEQIDYVNFYVHKNNQTSFENVEIIKNGNGFILQCDKETAKKIYSQIDYLDGISFELNFFDEIFLEDIKIVKTENVENIQIIYGFNKNLKKYITVDNNKINIQIAITNTKTTIGVPIILGSY